MNFKRANLKNVVAAFKKGGMSIDGEDVLPAEIYFLPRSAYENGHISKSKTDNSMPRGMFNRLTRNEVKKYLTYYDNHYIVW